MGRDICCALMDLYKLIYKAREYSWALFICMSNSVCVLKGDDLVAICQILLKRRVS